MSHPQRLRGHIYVVRFRGIPYTKVGLSAQPLKRVNQLRAAEGRGTEVESLWVSKGDWYETSHEGEIQRRLLTRYRRRVWPERPHQYTKEWSAAPWEDGVELAGELLPGEPPTHTYPVITRISAGAFNGSNQADYEPIGRYHSTRLVKPRVVDGTLRQPFAVQVNGHSMTNPALPQHFPDGTLALCDPGRMPDLNDFVAVVDLTDETLTLKQLVNRAKLPERDLWLVPLNPDPAYAAIKLDDDLHAVAGVVLEAYQPRYSKK